MNKYFLAALMLGCAGWLALSEPVQAQKGGGGRGGAPGGRGGAPGGRGGFGPGYGGRGYGYGYGRGFGPGYGYGFGRGFGWGFGIGFYGGYLYDPFWYGPGYGYYSPTVVVAGPAAMAGMQSTPLTVPEGAPKNAQIKVLVPDPDAKVWFDGSPTTSTGTERIFHTPDLQSGSTPTYRIRAAWVVNGKEIVQEQVVPVAPGRGSVADFTRPYSEALPPPPGKE